MASLVCIASRCAEKVRTGYKSGTTIQSILVGLWAVSSIVQSIPAYTIAAIEIPIAEAHIEKSETLEEMSDRIALEYGISTTTLSNLVDSESKWNPNALGKDGEVGLVQILPSAWPDITEDQMHDPEFSLRFAAEKIAKGEEYYWTVCSCMAFARVKGARLPRGNASDLVPNSEEPRVGGVVLLEYSQQSHVAYVERVTIEGIEIIESNFEPCKITRRTIKHDDPNIKGFWGEP